MNNSITSNEVREAFAEFHGLKTYNDRILFYDRYFGISLDEFPEFNSRLDIFFQIESSNSLVELFEKERKNSYCLEKIIEADGQIYSFNITPINSYSEVYNNYIISKFMDADRSLKDPFYNIQHSCSDEYSYVLQRESEALRLIELVHQKLLNGGEKGIRGKFMTVFYEGYSDQVSLNLRTFPKRMKLIELYLYSYGIMYARYQEAIIRSRKSYEEPDEMKEEVRVELAERMKILAESGVLEFLAQKHRNSNGLTDKVNLTVIVSQILGVHVNALIGLLEKFLL